MSIGNSPEVLNRRFLVGMILVGRLGVRPIPVMRSSLSKISSPMLNIESAASRRSGLSDRLGRSTQKPRPRALPMSGLVAHKWGQH